MKRLASLRETLAGGIAFVLLLVAIGGLVQRLGGTTTLGADWTAAAKKAGTYQMTMTTQALSTGRTTKLSASAFKLVTAIDVTHKLTSLTFTIDFGGAKVACTYVGDANGVYVHVDPTRRAEVRAEWLKTGTSSPVGIPGMQILPSELVSRSGKLFDHLHKDGDSTVDGVATTHYTGTIDPRDLVPSAAQSGVSKAFHEVPITVDADDDHLIRRMTLDMTLQGLTVRTTLHMQGFGKPVHITLPNPATARSGSLGEVATACYPTTLLGGKLKTP